MKSLKSWIGRFGIWCIRNATDDLSNSLCHAKRELDILNSDNDEWQSDISQDILDLLRIFSLQGHSGMSAGYASSIFNKLVAYQPLTPLTGEDSEWMSDSLVENKRQNVRATNVFMDLKTGVCYQIDGIVFEEEDGGRYTSINSRVKIESFPYMPIKKVVPASKEKKYGMGAPSVKS